MANKWVIEENTLIDGWTNTWSDSETGRASYFETEEEAQRELDNWFKETEEAVIAGEVADGYDREHFRIREIVLRPYKLKYARIVMLETEIEAESYDHAMKEASRLEDGGYLGLESNPSDQWFPVDGSQITDVTDYEEIWEVDSND